MPSEAFERNRQAWAAIGDRDLDAFLAIVDEDVEFISLVGEVDGGRYRGHEGVRQWWEQVSSSLGNLRYEQEEMRDLGAGGVLTKPLVTGTVSEVEVQQTMWHVVSVPDGKAVWWGAFRTEAEALAE